MIERVRAGTECAMGEDQCGLRQGRWRIYEELTVKQVCEKNPANEKEIFWAFMDLEKTNDTIDRHGMWS